MNGVKMNNWRIVQPAERTLQPACSARDTSALYPLPIPLLLHPVSDLSLQLSRNDFYLPGRIDYLYLRANQWRGQIVWELVGRLFRSRKLFNTNVDPPMCARE